MNSADRRKLVATAAGLSLAAFGVLWTLLEPAGGFAALDDVLSRSASNYIALVAVSLAIGVVGAVERQRGDQSRKKSASAVGRSRLDVDFHRLLLTAENRVILVGISLPTFTSEAGLRIVSRVLRRDVRVDLVFMNPLSPAIFQRPSRLYDSYDTPAIAAATSLHSCIRFRDALGAEDADRFRVHLTNVLPACAAVIIDEECFWHPYLAGHSGVTSPYQRDRTSEGFGRFVFTHVEEVIDELSFQASSCEPQALIDAAESDPMIRTTLTPDETQTIQNRLSS